MWIQLTQMGLLTLALGSGLTSTLRQAYSQDSATQTPRTQTDDQKPRANVKLYSQLVTTEKYSGVEEVYLDLELSFAALVVSQGELRPFTAPPGKQIAKPVQIVANITRSMVKALCDACGQQPYWDELLKSPAKSKLQLNKLDLEKYELRSAKSILNREIRASDGKEKLGHISDAALDMETGELLYLVLKSNDELRAVPLGAFEGNASAKFWKIALPSELVYQFKPFTLSEFPKSIDRGWTEFISIKYGRNGLQAD